MTGPAGGLLAIAGDGATATIGACCLGRGTMRRGAGTAAGATAAGALACATGLTGGTTGLAATGAAATAAGRGGELRACSSAWRRARIAFIASPGFEMCERSKAGLVSVCGLADAPPLRRFLK